MPVQALGLWGSMEALSSLSCPQVVCLSLSLSPSLLHSLSPSPPSLPSLPPSISHTTILIFVLPLLLLVPLSHSLSLTLSLSLSPSLPLSFHKTKSVCYECPHWSACLLGRAVVCWLGQQALGQARHHLSLPHAHRFLGESLFNCC